jgi:environmental stress-induced protein Ves
VAVHPPGASLDDFTWRVSIAAIDADAEFSTFAGIDRFLMPLSPGGLKLVDEGERRHLSQFEVWQFAGERNVSATGVEEPSTDLNLMVRRGARQGSLSTEAVLRHRDFTAEPGTELLIVVLEGALSTADNAALDPLDALVLGGGGTGTATLSGDGRVAIARVW